MAGLAVDERAMREAVRQKAKADSKKKPGPRTSTVSKASSISEERSQEQNGVKLFYDPDPSDEGRFELQLPTADSFVGESPPEAVDEDEGARGLEYTDSQARALLGDIYQQISSELAERASSESRFESSPMDAGSMNVNSLVNHDVAAAPRNDVVPRPRIAPKGTPPLPRESEDDSIMQENYASAYNADDGYFGQNSQDADGVQATPANIGPGRDQMLTVARRPPTAWVPSPRKVEPRPSSVRSPAAPPRVPAASGSIKPSKIKLRDVVLAEHSRQGYKIESRHNPRPVFIHDEMEDAFKYVAKVKHEPMGFYYRLLIMADGHGGPRCARYVVDNLPEKIKQKMNAIATLNQQKIEDAFVEAIQEIDAEYVVILRKRFESWKAKGGDENTRPPDDGSTLIVNAILPDFMNPGSGEETFINFNVGDSRTCLLETVNRARFRFDVVNWSEDQHPGHPEKALHIIHGTAATAIIKLADPKSQNLLVPRNLYEMVPHDAKRAKPIDTLRQGRVMRTEEYLGADSEAVKLGLATGQHINCGDAMGDLLFKLHPAVFKCKPEIFSHVLLPDRRYIICAATDGVWDALKIPAKQPRKQVEEVAQLIQRGLQEEVNKQLVFSTQGGSTLTTEALQSRLNRFARGLVEIQANEYKVFTDHTIYDDATMVLMEVAEAEGHAGNFI
jgi:serine/threonine protein phosphatase PrpC